MKNYKFKFSFLYIPVLAMLLYSCQSDFELTRSVFIEDQDHPGLPVYSEWGYDSFGMYIDRRVFVSSDNFYPAKVIVNPDTFNILLTGDYNNYPMTLKLSIAGYAPQDYPDLVALNDSVFDLKSSDCIVTLGYSGTQGAVLDIIEGNMTFKKVQNLFVDKEFVKTILSGTIEFKTFMNGEPVSVSDGRFDVNIGYENFFYY